jgi:hypothetical protein
MSLMDPALDYYLSNYYFAGIRVYVLQQILIPCRKFWTNLPARINSRRQSIGFFLVLRLRVYLSAVGSKVSVYF